MQILASREQLNRLDQADSLYQVISQILRMYEGVLLEPVAINEFRLAERTGLAKGYIRTVLSKAHSDELLHYVPESDEPLMTFAHPRVEYRNVRIDKDRIVKLREQAKERLQWVFKFLDAPRCREQVLLNYFGEDDAVECGRCDLCRSRIDAPSESIVLSRIPNEGIPLKSLLRTFDVSHENVVKAYLSSLESDRLIILEKGNVKRKQS